MPDDLGPPDRDAEGLRARVEAAVGSQYRIVRLLGQGGMGAVFLAREEALDRLVAIKVLPQGTSDPESRERFRREAKLAAQLSHPNIVPLLGFGEVSSTMYLVMGYVSGESLGARLKRDVRLSADEARRILADLAEALDYAHRRNVIHRDIKPDNILIDDETGRAFLADFGIARGMGEGESLTRVGDVVGTPQYMSPEQARGTTLDGRSDLYSLGVVGFTLLAGRTPFQGRSSDAIVQRLTTDAPKMQSAAPDVPGELAQAIDRCLARDRDARFPDARAFRQAVAPTSLDEEQLPEPLDVLDGGGISIVLGCLLCLLVSLYFLQPSYEGYLSYLRYAKGRSYGHVVLDWFLSAPNLIPIGLWALLSLQLQLPLAAARAARARGFSWRDIRFAFLRQPVGWRGLWYPVRYRRKDDVWPRLPTQYRRARVLMSIAGGAALFLLFLFIAMGPVALVTEGMVEQGKTLAGTRNLAVTLAIISRGILDLTMGTTILILSPATMALLAYSLFQAERFLASRGLDRFTRHRVSRALLFGPTADRAAWKQPLLASFLSDASAAPAERPGSSAEYPERMARLTSNLTGEFNEVAAEAVAAVRRIVSEIAILEHELPRLERDADLKEAARIDARLKDLQAPDTDDQRAMRDLLQQQREILRRAATRLDARRQDRARAIERINSLWDGVAGLGAGRGTSPARLRTLLESELPPAPELDEATKQRTLTSV